MRSLVLVGRARELIVSTESYIYCLFLQRLSTVLSLGAAEVMLSIKCVKVNRDRHFCRSASRRWPHLQLRAILGTLESSPPLCNLGGFEALVGSEQRCGRQPPGT